MGLLSEKEVTVFFDQVIDGFEAMTTMSDNAHLLTVDPATQQNSSDVIWRPEEQYARIVGGLDVSGVDGDVIELAVPAPLDTIDNDKFSLNALELRDKRFMERRASAAARLLSTNLNVNTANLVANTGTLVVERTTPPSNYSDIAACETRMDALEIPIAESRSMFLETQTYGRISENLANKDRTPLVETAIRSSKFGNFASFETFRTNFQPLLPASSDPTVAIAGADQFHVPTPTETSAGGVVVPLDNRGMNIVVSTSVGVAVGDAFTIADVFEVSGISKLDTGTLRTFRVTSIVDATTLAIYPRIIPLDQIGTGLDASEGTYANVGTTPADLAVITWINLSAVKVNSFWRNDTIGITAGKLAWEADMFAGATFKTMTTSNGVEIVMAIEGTAMTGVVDIRLTTFYGLVNLDPQQNGIMADFT